MIDAGEYFTINRARQYGKTTMLQELALYLKPDYIVVSLDFQTMSSSDFQSECSFVNGLAREIEKKIRRMKEIPSKIQQKFAVFSREMNPDTRMADIFECFTDWCELSEKPLVFMIDEVDTASNNQVFLDFLAQLRGVFRIIACDSMGLLMERRLFYDKQGRYSPCFEIVSFPIFLLSVS